MAKEVSNGDHNSVTKPPPTPSPLRNSKFFQVNCADLCVKDSVFCSGCYFPGYLL